MQTYRDSVEKTCNSIDECVNEEEVLLRKARELSKTMEPVYKLRNKIVSIKTVLATLESQI